MGQRDEQKSFARFWEIMEAHRPALDAAVEERALRIPIFAKLMAAMSPEVRATQAEHGREMQRRALVEGRWDEYTADARAQGRLYAQMGIEFPQWYDLLASYRNLIVEATLADARAADAEWVADVLYGMDRLLDIAMSTIGAAYLDTKEVLIRRAESLTGVYSDAFRAASLGIAILHWEDPPDLGSFRLIDVNPTAMTLSARSRPEHVGQLIRDYAPDLVDTEALRDYAAVIETRAPREWTASAQGDDGKDVWYQAYCFTPRERYVCVIFQNITERRRMEEQIASHVRDLERSNQELDQFAYVASHDLKAPLQDIRNLATWIAEDLGEAVPPQTARHVTLLGERTRRMENLLEDLLAYSRAGRPVESEEVSLGDVLDEALAMIPSASITRSASAPPAEPGSAQPGFHIEVRGPMPRLRTPRAPLAQAIRNVVGNGIKHHDRPSGRVTVSVAEEPDALRISVTDDGPGIPPEFHQRVFQMFQTLRPRDRVEGSGMGLAIVKKVVEAHGGSVGIESRGRGTTVHITWPRRVSRRDGEQQP